MKKIAPIVFLLLLLTPMSLPGRGGKKYDPTTLVFPSFLHTMGVRKATKLHFMIYTKNKVKVRDPQGIAVVRLRSWDDPNNKKDDDEVTGYGVNSGENVVVYNTSMTGISIYGLKQKGEKALNHPMGIAANAEGDVYVADTGNHRIVRLKNPKRKLQFVRGIGGEGALPGQFKSPTGVALDSNGMVYVCDTGNHRIQILRPDARLHLWFGEQGVEDGQLWHPSGIAVTDHGQPWSFYKDAFIALIDLDHTRLQKFTLDGKFVKAIRLKDFGYQSGQLAYLALDYYSNIWVTDFENHCIHKFDGNLNYLTSFGRFGKDDKEFNEPRGIAIYRRFGQVFVAEKESAQYYWIGTDVFNFRGHWDAEKKLVVLDFFLTEPSYITLSVKRDQGPTVKVFEKAKYFSGHRRIYLDEHWKRIPEHRVENSKAYGNGVSDKLQSIPEGTYKLKLKVEATYSSYKYFSKEVKTELRID
ncbi:MAG: NHL repeat-containing protein [bacterium]